MCRVLVEGLQRFGAPLKLLDPNITAIESNTQTFIDQCLLILL